MANRFNTETAEMGYLLGTLSAQEAARLEHEFFTDDEKFQELELAEDDLIDAYVRGELSDAEERQFREKLMIVPRIAERVNFAQALAERTPKPVPPPPIPQPEPLVVVQPQTKRRWWQSLFGSGPQLRPALAACVAVIVVGGLFLLTVWRGLQHRSAELAAERAAVQRQKENLDRQSTELQARTEQQTAELKQQRDQLAEKERLLEERLHQAERSPSLIGSIATFLLVPGGSRDPGAGGADLKLAPGAATVKLQLALAKAEHRSYNVTVTAVDDDEVVHAKKGLGPRKTGANSMVVISVPARRLPPGDYLVDVAGVASSGKVEPVNNYSFRVLKTPK